MAINRRAATENGAAYAPKNDPNLLDFSHWKSFNSTDMMSLTSDNISGFTTYDNALWLVNENKIVEFEIIMNLPAEGTSIEFSKNVESYCLSMILSLLVVPQVC